MNRKTLLIFSLLSFAFSVAATGNIIAYDPFDTTTSSSAADPENGLYWANVDSGDGSIAGEANRATRNGGIIGFGEHIWEGTHTTFRPQSSRLETPLRSTEQNGAVRILNFKGSTGGPSVPFRTVWRDLDDYAASSIYYQSGIVQLFTEESGNAPGGFALFGFGNETISDSSVMDENSSAPFEGLLWGFRANEGGDRIDLIVRATVDAATNQIEDFVLVEGVVQRQNYFVVVRVEVDPDGKDTVTAWVDPGITAGGGDPPGGVTFEAEAFSSTASITRFAMNQSGLLHTGGNSSINRVAYFDAPTLGTTYASVTDVAEFFYQAYGTDPGRSSGADLDRNVPEEWSLTSNALRLTGSGGDYRESFATAEMTHFTPGVDFGLRSRITLDGLDAAAAENAVGHVILGVEDPPNGGSLEDFYYAHWVPNGSGGSVLRIRRGAEGEILAEAPWEGLSPSSGSPLEGIGSTYTLTTLGAYGAGGDLELTFRLDDAAGNTARVTVSIGTPLEGGRFGFGAWHRGAENPVWSFHDFGMTERWLLDYRPVDAPLSYTFGEGAELDTLDDLVLAHPRPDAWTLEHNGARFARSSGSWESSVSAASVSNYHTGQDFTVEVEMTLARLDNIGLNRLGLAVLGSPHEPFANPFDAGIDNSFYGLMWYPAVDAVTSQLRIRRGFNGADLETATWTGMHPNMNNPMEGIGTRYTLRAEGVFDENGALDLSFTLTDQNGHSQTISTTIANPVTGSIFGFGGRTHGDENPEAVFHTLSLELGDSPVPDGVTYEDWLVEYFTPAQREDDEISGIAANPARDGIANLIKYAMGYSPWTPLTGADVGTPAAVDGQLVLTYRERTDATDIEYVVEVSEDFEDWNDGPGFAEEIDRASLEEGVDEVTVQALLPDGAAKAFIRVRVRFL